MVEESDSPDVEGDGEKKENDPVHPPPLPPGLETPPPPPPPPPGFPELPDDAESISTKSSQNIDQEAARRMLLGLEEPNEATDRGEVAEEETLQESIEPENSDDEVEEPPEEDHPPTPTGFSEEPEEEEGILLRHLPWGSKLRHLPWGSKLRHLPCRHRFSEEPEEEGGASATSHGVRSSATAARVLRRARGRGGDTPPPPPMGFGLRHRRQGSPKSPRKRRGIRLQFPMRWLLRVIFLL